MGKLENFKNLAGTRTVNACGWIVLDSQINVLSNAKACKEKEKQENTTVRGGQWGVCVCACV
jgi:hypothetical protein